MLVEIEDELYQVLKKVAKSMNLSISDYIRANLYKSFNICSAFK